MMKHVTLAVPLILLIGCAYPNQFCSVPTGEPYAVLVGEKVAVLHLNKQPTSFWRCREHYRIPPGSITLDVTSNTWSVPDYPTVTFEAIVDCRYTLTYQWSNELHHILLWERRAEEGAERLVTRVEAKTTL